MRFLLAAFILPAVIACSAAQVPAPSDASPQAPSALVATAATPSPTPTPTAPPLPEVSRATYAEFLVWRQDYGSRIDAAIRDEDWPRANWLKVEARIGPVPFDSRPGALLPYACYADAAMVWDHQLNALYFPLPKWGLPGDELAPPEKVLDAWNYRSTPTASCSGADASVPTGPRVFWDPEPPPVYNYYREWAGREGQYLHPDVWRAALATWDTHHHELVVEYETAAKAKDHEAAVRAAREIATWSESFKRFVALENNVSWACYDVLQPMNVADSRTQFGRALAKAWATSKPARSLVAQGFTDDPFTTWWWFDSSVSTAAAGISTSCDLQPTPSSYWQ